MPYKMTYFASLVGYFSPVNIIAVLNIIQKDRETVHWEATATKRAEEWSEVSDSDALSEKF